jgi:hypothetical protein
VTKNQLGLFIFFRISTLQNGSTTWRRRPGVDFTKSIMGKKFGLIIAFFLDINFYPTIAVKNTEMDAIIGFGGQ